MKYITLHFDKGIAMYFQFFISFSTKPVIFHFIIFIHKLKRLEKKIKNPKI